MATVKFLNEKKKDINKCIKLLVRVFPQDYLWSTLFFTALDGFLAPPLVLRFGRSFLRFGVAFGRALLPVLWWI